MIDTPVVLQTETVTAAVIHLTIPRRDMMSAFGPAIGEVISVVQEQDIGPSGSVFAHHLSINPETFDFKVGVPVSKMVTPSGRVEAAKLPATTVARTIHRGPYDGLPKAWAEFEKWIASEKLVTRQDIWEVYTVGPESSENPDDWQTELNWPLST